MAGLNTIHGLLGQDHLTNLCRWIRFRPLPHLSHLLEYLFVRSVRVLVFVFGNFVLHELVVSRKWFLSASSFPNAPA